MTIEGLSLNSHVSEPLWALWFCKPAKILLVYPCGRQSRSSFPDNTNNVISPNWSNCRPQILRQTWSLEFWPYFEHPVFLNWSFVDFAIAQPVQFRPRQPICTFHASTDISIRDWMNCSLSDAQLHSSDDLAQETPTYSISMNTGVLTIWKYSKGDTQSIWGSLLDIIGLVCERWWDLFQLEESAKTLPPAKFPCPVQWLTELNVMAIPRWTT
jgi:hypothetical protein